MRPGAGNRDMHHGPLIACYERIALRECPLTSLSPAVCISHYQPRADDGQILAEPCLCSYVRIRFRLTSLFRPHAYVCAKQGERSKMVGGVNDRRVPRGAIVRKENNLCGML